MRHAIALLACIGLSPAVSSPALAAWQTGDAAVDEIVTTAVPPAQLVDALAQAYDKGFRDKLVPQLAPLEKQHSGLTAQVRADAAAEIRRMMTAQTPELFAALRSIYLHTLSPAEVVALRDFYRSDAGRRMAEAAFTGARDQTLADLGRTAPAAARERAYENAVVRAAGAVSNDDSAVLSAFAQTSAAAKLLSLAPLQQEAVQRWTASIDVRNRTRIQSAITASIRRYVAGHPASRSHSR